MPRGLVRDENLADLPNRDEALRNLGISIEDVERIRGAAFPYGVRPQDIQRIVASSGNFQNQLDTFNTQLNNLTQPIGSGAYVLRAGDTISGTWTNTGGYIQASGIYQSGSAATPSTDALFAHAADGTFELTTAVLRCPSGLSTERFIDHNNIIMSGTLTPNLLYPISINGVPYHIEAARL
jgi:hypothetical protein